MYGLTTGRSMPDFDIGFVIFPDAYPARFHGES